MRGGRGRKGEGEGSTSSLGEGGAASRIDMQQAAYTGNAGANNTTTGKAPCKLFGVPGRITYRAVPLDTARDSLHGAASADRDAPYLASDVPPVWKHGYVLLLFFSLSLDRAAPPHRPMYRHGVIHPPVRDFTGAQSSSTFSSASSSTISASPR